MYIPLGLILLVSCCRSRLTASDHLENTYSNSFCPIGLALSALCRDGLILVEAGRKGVKC